MSTQVEIVNSRSQSKSRLLDLALLVLPFAFVALFASVLTYEVCYRLSPLGIGIRNNRNVTTLAKAISTALVVGTPGGDLRSYTRRYTGSIFVAGLFVLYFIFLYMSGRFFKHPNDCLVCIQITALSTHFILCLLIISSVTNIFFSAAK